MQQAAACRSATSEFLNGLPANFSQWHSLSQDQHIEIRTLLAGYLLSSQGDRMLLGNSVEGRFPFLDPQVIALANALPAAYKLRVLDEKHVLKRVAHGAIPQDIIARQKQPYRAPDALSFVAPDAPEYIQEALCESAVRAAHVFEPKAVAQLFNKCRSRGAQGQFSNADNMALVAVLSTQLLHQQFIASCPGSTRSVGFTTDCDKTIHSSTSLTS
jgi:asparagine synthase (glutamine-hydrolysing)